MVGVDDSTEKRKVSQAGKGHEGSIAVTIRRHIEFCGLAGSGKTHCAQALVAHMQQKGVAALDLRSAVLQCLQARNDGRIKNTMKRFPRQVWERFLGSEYALREFQAFALEHAELFRVVFSVLAGRRHATNENGIALNSLTRLCAEYHLASTHLEQEVLVVEEGFAQRGFTLVRQDNGRDPEAILRKYVGGIPIPDTVIWVDTPVDTCVRRLRLRQAPPEYLRGLSAVTCREQLMYGRRVFETITGTLSELGVEVLRYEAPGDEEPLDILMGWADEQMKGLSRSKRTQRSKKEAG
jgi:hypothetical protein